MKKTKSNPKSTRSARGTSACDGRESVMRKLCTAFTFWKFCGDRRCLRAQRCVGDYEACFGRIWPLVPEDLKVGLQAGVKARLAGLSMPDTKAAIKREIARWRALNEQDAMDGSRREGHNGRTNRLDKAAGFPV